MKKPIKLEDIDPQYYKDPDAPSGEQENEGERLRLQWKDIIAIIIAIYKIFIPWALAIAGIYALLMLLFQWIF